MKKITLFMLTALVASNVSATDIYDQSFKMACEGEGLVHTIERSKDNVVTVEMTYKVTGTTLPKVELKQKHFSYESGKFTLRLDAGKGEEKILQYKHKYNIGYLISLSDSYGNEGTEVFVLPVTKCTGSIINKYAK